MSARKAKAGSFEAAILKRAAKSSAKELAEPLGKLVSLRLRKRQTTKPEPAAATPSYGVAPLSSGRGTPMATPTTGIARVRRAGRPRRLGKFRRYTATSKLDFSRPGTFRTYMISTIRAHTDTQSANAAHANCLEPSFAKNRLDFNWAADNGYIVWEN